MADNWSGVPFLSNIDQKIQDELNNRAKIRVRPITPFIKATPGFTFDGNRASRPIFKGIADQILGLEPWQFGFRDLYKSENAFRPIAGITGVTVEYKQVTGAIRKATMTWVCHSLADLEKLGPYFLAPGRTLFIEYGWSNYNVPGESTPRGGSNVIDTSDMYKEYRVDNYYSKVRDNVLKTNGNYDALLGVIVNYDLSMNPDGGFTCVTHVTSMGDLMGGFSMTNQHMTDPGEDKNLKGTSGTSGKASSFSEALKVPMTLRQYIDDYMDSDLLGRLNKEFGATGGFGVKKYPEYDTDDVFICRYKDKENESKKPGVYMSWGFIEDYILYTFLPYTCGNTLLVRYYSGDSRIKTHGWLRTTDLDICIIPFPSGDTSGNNALPPFTISGKLPTTAGFPGTKDYANPRRILINADFFKKTFINAKTVEDGIAAIFSKVNDACGNLWNFRIRTISEFGDGYVPKGIKNNPVVLKSIIDESYTDADIIKSSKKAYQFKIKSFTVKKGDSYERATGIIRSITLNTKLSNDAALNIMYTANTNGKLNIGNDAVLRSMWNYKLPNKTPKDVFVNPISSGDNNNIKTQADISATRDKWAQEEAAKQQKQNDEKSKQLALDQQKYGDQAGWPDEILKFLPIVDKGRGFNWAPKLPGYTTEADTIDKGREMMRAAAYITAGENSAVYEAVAPMSCEIELEGISGIRAGDIFTVDNLPSLYNDKGVFQVVGITHEITRETWKTKLKSRFRIQRTPIASNPADIAQVTVDTTTLDKSH